MKWLTSTLLLFDFSAMVDVPKSLKIVQEHDWNLNQGEVYMGKMEGVIDIIRQYIDTIIVDESIVQ